MPLNIGTKVYRTLQEQVGYNSERIKQIADYIDGLDVQDSVIVLESLSPLNSEQMKVAEQPLAFIVYNEAIYLKTKEDATYYYFERMMKMELDTYVTLSSAVIQVTKLNGATGITVSSVDVYSVSQINTALSLKADVTYVDSQLAAGLAAKANLNGASFTGPITAPSIIEDMAGYAFVKSSSTANMEVEYKYAGVVKNGNKITFVIFLRLKRTSGSGGFEIGRFTMPSAVLNKLYSFDVSGTSYLDIRKVTAASANNAGVDLFVYNQKYSNRINIWITNQQNLTADTDFYLRYEITFMLSSNLAQ